MQRLWVRLYLFILIKTMDEKEIEQQQSWGTLENIIQFLRTYASAWLLQSVISGIIILVIVMTATGTPISSLTDKWFDLQKTELTQTYELQKQSFEYMQNEIKPQLDQIMKRLDNVDSRVTSVEGRVTNLEKALKQHKISGK